MPFAGKHEVTKMFNGGILVINRENKSKLRILFSVFFEGNSIRSKIGNVFLNYFLDAKGLMAGPKPFVNAFGLHHRLVSWFENICSKIEFGFFL